ncbi:MAG: aminotransferase class I/II-fold pyridoxal phosphate-dependent enzyme [Candidatus Odinarchaeota archaeon]
MPTIPLRSNLVTERTKTIHYAIRDVVVAAKKLEAQGQKITFLNIGDPNVYDFETPHFMIEAFCKAAKQGFNGYSASQGIPEFREAVAEKEKRINQVSILAQDVIATAGISEGIQMMMAALVHPNSEVLVPGPTYPPYLAFVRFFNGKAITYRCIEAEGWRPDIDDIRAKISDTTAAMVLINPNNPTGAIYPPKTLQAFIDLAGEYGIPLISDEVYDRLTYDQKAVSTASLADDVPIIGFNGLSKVFLVPGWRIGYMYFHHQNQELNELKEHILKQARIRICTNAPAQYAAATALRESDAYLQDVLSRLRERRDLVWERLNEINGISAAKPEGAFYIFPSIDLQKRWSTDEAFVMALLKETGVLVVHGSGFDPIYGAGHFRLVFLAPPTTLNSALSAIKQFVEKSQ